MFKNFWYALAFSDEVTHKPSRHRILAQDLVMWRTPTGQVRALSDLCVHRGARLSGGWTDGENIVCPYHGWGYGADGSCTVIPANRDGKVVSKKARVDSYPVEERHGWVWVFMGDIPEEQRVPIPDLSFMDDPNYRAIRGTWNWDANYERVVENGTDQSHTAFVHRGVFGNPDDAEVGEFELDAHEWSASLSVKQRSPNRPSGGLHLRNRYEGEPPPVFVRTSFFFPAVVMIDLTVPKLGRIIIWDTNIPVDEDTTLTKYVAYRDFYTSPWADFIQARMVRKVFAQDDAVVQEVRPELIPEEMSGELHLRSDAMSLEFRRVRQQAVDLGYSVLGTSQGTKSSRSIIASPYRHEPGLERAWVFPATPASQESQALN